jgi:Leucine-rich repeat (LRR) protein
MFIGTIQTEGLNMRGGMPTIIMSPDELMSCRNTDSIINHNSISEQDIANNMIIGIHNGKSIHCYYTDALLESLSIDTRDPITRDEFTTDQIREIYSRSTQEARDKADRTWFNQNVEKEEEEENDLDYSDTGMTDINLSGIGLTDDDVPLLLLPDTLETLDLNGNYITTVSQLQLPDSLIELDLHDNQVTDVSQLQIPNSIAILDLQNNLIVDVGILSDRLRMRSINVLKLSGNQIEDVSQLVLPDSLIALDIDNNQIEDVSQFTLPDNLKYLMMRNNPIRNIDKLKLPDSIVDIKV